MLSTLACQVRALRETEVVQTRGLHVMKQYIARHDKAMTVVGTGANMVVFT